MMDDETRWQDATLNADTQLIGPVKPADAAPEGDAGDYDELESGIASIFAALQAAGSEGTDADREADEPGDDAEFDDTHTFQLLSELDRLWQRPSP